MEDLKGFVSEILKRKGIENLDDDVNQELVAQLAQRLNTRINRNVILALDDKYIDEINALVNAGRGNEMGDVIDRSGIDQQAIASRTMMEFAKEYLGGGR